MKVCILSSVHSCFDTRIFHKEARSLATAGYEVTLVAVADFAEREVDLVRILGIPERKTRALRPLNWWRILRIALREKAHLYHLHDPELLPIGILIRSLTQGAVIYDVHENYPEDILTKPWIPRYLRKIISALFRVFEDRIVGLLDGIVVVNERLTERFSGHSRVVLVSNYSRIEQFAGQGGTSGEEKEFLKPYFVYTGLISDDRGILQCIKALDRLNDADAILVCAGRIGDVRNGELKALLEDPQRRAAFHHLGLLPYEDIPPILKGALAGLLCFQPTPNNVLGSPNKLFEYMSAGIPVIASDFPLIREVVVQAECGLLVPPHDIAAIAKAMTYLLRNPDEAKRMGANGSRAARQRYNWQVEEEKLLSLYRALSPAVSNPT